LLNGLKLDQVGRFSQQFQIQMHVLNSNSATHTLQILSLHSKLLVHLLASLVSVNLELKTAREKKVICRVHLRLSARASDREGDAEDNEVHSFQVGAHFVDVHCDWRQQVQLVLFRRRQQIVQLWRLVFTENGPTDDFGNVSLRYGGDGLRAVRDTIRSCSAGLQALGTYCASLRQHIRIPCKRRRPA
jgi:hypothetical protein